MLPFPRVWWGVWVVLVALAVASWVGVHQGPHACETEVAKEEESTLHGYMKYSAILYTILASATPWILLVLAYGNLRAWNRFGTQHPCLDDVIAIPVGILMFGYGLTCIWALLWIGVGIGALEANPACVNQGTYLGVATVLMVPVEIVLLLTCLGMWYKLEHPRRPTEDEIQLVE